MSAREQWTRELAAWAIPPEIIAAAPESPWGFPTEVFAHKADNLPPTPTLSTRRALEALPVGGAALDVGCGAGAGLLPLVPTAGRLVAVDPSAGMLEATRTRVEALGKSVTTIEGDWPGVADQTPAADVVVCHHVFYNTQDLAPFAQRLTDHALRRVVVELSASHPMTALNGLWLRFHGLVRPTTPTADDAMAVLRELGLEPEREDWAAPLLSWSGPTAQADLVAWVRRRLCLPADRDPEIAAVLAETWAETNGAVSLPSRPTATLWWPGTA